MPFSVNALKLIIKGQIWFASPTSFNDVFEGMFEIEDIERVPNDEFLRGFYEENLKLRPDKIDEKINQIHSNPNVFRDDISPFVKELMYTDYGISCFSKKGDNALMWSHYADSHRGICLVFDKNELRKSFMGRRIEMGEVDYKRNSPIRVTMKCEDNSVAFDAESSVFFNKMQCWSYEEEVRMFYEDTKKHKRRSVPFSKSCLKAIIFGERTDEDDKNTLVHLIENDSDYNLKWVESSKNLGESSMSLTVRNYKILRDMKLKISIR